eukprot:COSAG01_NODE_2714_length_7204_cov_8.116397_3_plen_73_part_00
MHEWGQVDDSLSQNSASYKYCPRVKHGFARGTEFLGMNDDPARILCIYHMHNVCTITPNPVLLEFCRRPTDD